MYRLFAVVVSSMPGALLAAVDETSAAYQNGRYVGYAFLAVLAVLVLRKIFKK